MTFGRIVFWTVKGTGAGASVGIGTAILGAATVGFAAYGVKKAIDAFFD